jgi:hypothetical protein
MCKTLKVAFFYFPLVFIVFYAIIGVDKGFGKDLIVYNIIVP